MSIDSRKEALTERELRLVLALDRIRDMLHEEDDPQGMFTAIAGLLKNELQAEGCAIMLVAETSDDIECVAGAGLPDEVAVQLCQQAAELPAPAELGDTRWTFSLGVQIILDDFPMGGIALVRDSRPFDGDEIALLALAVLASLTGLLTRAYRAERHARAERAERDVSEYVEKNEVALQQIKKMKHLHTP
jgi:hypothetical protein